MTMDIIIVLGITATFLSILCAALYVSALQYRNAYSALLAENEQLKRALQSQNTIRNVCYEAYQEMMDEARRTPNIPYWK